MAQLNFDAREVKPSAAPEPVPAGKYLAEITASEMKPIKNGQGSYLELEMTIADGEFRGRRVWDRLCINHPNTKTVEIARANLSAICHAIGVMQPQDSVELHNLPMVVTVKCKKREDTGDVNNEIKGYAKPEAATGQPQQAPVNSNTAPWQRG